MKDGLLLLLTGIVCAFGGWLFFRFLGNEAISVMMMFTMVSAVLDNIRLRRKLRALGGEQESKRV